MSTIMKAALLGAVTGAVRISPPMNYRGAPQIVFEKPDGGGTPEQEMKTLATDLKKATDEVKGFAEKVMTDMKNLGKVTDETKASADKALTEMGTFSTRLADIEQKVARRTTASVDEAKSLGELFIQDEQVKAFLAGNKRGLARLTIEGKTVINLSSGTATVGATTSVGTSLVTPERVGLVPLPQRKLVVRDLISPGQTSSNNIEYARQVTFQNLAATVAETGQKPQSDMTFNLVSAPVRTIAHFMKASRQILDDSPQLRSFIDEILTYGLKFVEDQQLLTGDGTGQNLTGLVTAATAYSAPFTEPGGTTAIDRIRFAILQAALALYPSTGIVLNPQDWTVIETLKDSLGRYIVGDPQGQATPMLWGLPVVESIAMASGNFLTGAFRGAAQIFDRLQTEVLVSTEDTDNFQKNMVTIRAEERLALAIYVPGAFITGTLP
jgi:HK97 family phage major capsid protein